MPVKVRSAEFDAMCVATDRRAEERGPEKRVALGDW